MRRLEDFLRQVNYPFEYFHLFLIVLSSLFSTVLTVQGTEKSSKEEGKRREGKAN